MFKTDFTVDKCIVRLLCIGYAFILFMGTISRLKNWVYSRYLLAVGVAFLFSAWVIVFADMKKRRIYNKTFWVLSMFIVPLVTPFVYAFRREKVICFETDIHSAPHRERKEVELSRCMEEWQMPSEN